MLIIYRIHNIDKYQYIIWLVKTDLGKIFIEIRNQGRLTDYLFMYYISYLPIYYKIL